MIPETLLLNVAVNSAQAQKQLLTIQAILAKLRIPNMEFTPGKQTPFAQKMIDMEGIKIRNEQRQAYALMDKLNEKKLKDAERAATKARSAMLGFGLSTLFAGMMLKRLGDSVTKSLIKTYMTATDENNVLNQKLMGVNAAFEFMKFAIMDALNSELFITIIGWVIELINWFSNLIVKFPEIGVALIAAFACLSAGGAIMIVVGNFLTFWQGVSGLGALPGLTAGIMGTKAAEAGTVAGSMSTGMGVLNKIIGAGLLIAVGWYLWNKAPGESYSAMEWFSIVGLAAVAGWKLGGWPGAFASATIVLSVMAIRSGAVDKALDWVTGKINDAKESLKAWSVGADMDKLSSVYKHGAPGLTSTMYGDEAMGITPAWMKEAGISSKYEGAINITINGDVSDERIIDKAVDKIQSNITRSNGVSTGG